MKVTIYTRQITKPYKFIQAGLLLTKGPFYLRYSRGGKQVCEPVGNTPAEALRQQERVLAVLRKPGTDGTFTTVRTQYYKVLLTCDYGLAILRHVSRKTHLRPSLPASPHPTSAVQDSLLRYRIISLLRTDAETRSFIFNSLHTLLNSQFRLSLSFC